jgi:hypothetical protein
MSAATGHGWLTRAETADRTGTNVRTIDSGIADGSIPHRKVGRRVLVPSWWATGGDLGAAPDGRTALDVERVAEQLAAAVVRELARLLGEAAARATAAGEPATVLDLYARDDDEVNGDGTG